MCVRRDLSWNYFDGTVLSVVKDFEELTHLNVSHNNISLISRALFPSSLPLQTLYERMSLFQNGCTNHRTYLQHCTPSRFKTWHSVMHLPDLVGM
jgi:hypothetical protein